MSGQDFIAALEKALQGAKGGLEAQLRMAPEFRKEEIAKKKSEDAPARKSAVIILINALDNEPKLIFTKRSPKLKVHRGQVSFPGGQCDKEDQSPLHTALRELREEIGIDSEDVAVLGSLSDLFIPPSNFDVKVLVGALKRKPEYKLNYDEVAEVVEVPVRMLLDAGNVKEKVFYKSTSGRERKAPYYDVIGLEIWGATAMIVSELLDLLRRHKIMP